jgi:carboxymethylenebutenolidase
VVYPDTPHGFFCHRRETFREKPAEDGWNRVRELLAAELS